jgi:hypothetical protein
MGEVAAAVAVAVAVAVVAVLILQRVPRLERLTVID